jgi:hypothetical protein
MTMNPARPHAARRLVLLSGVLAVVAATLVVTTPAQGVLASISARWPASTVRVNSATYVTGQVSGVQVGTGVALEQLVSGGWRVISRTNVDRYRRYRIRVPTWWLGTRTYRVRSTAVLGAATSRRGLTVAPGYRPAGHAGQHSWMSRTATRWNPCAPIGYRVNAQQGGAGALADAKAAFRRLGQATGLRFVYRGTTTRVPQYGGNSWYPRDTQVVVAWARRWQSSLFSLYRGAVGVGAALSTSGYYNGNGTATNKIIKGMVVIDSSKRYRGGFGRGKTRGEILLHELGHAVGLGHHGSTSQLMYPYLTDRAALYGRGDLRGMWLRGARMGCLFQSRLGLRTTTRVSALP